MLYLGGSRNKMFQRSFALLVLCYVLYIRHSFTAFYIAFVSCFALLLLVFAYFTPHLAQSRGFCLFSY